jgi:hypothetical protein
MGRMKLLPLLLAVLPVAAACGPATAPPPAPNQAATATPEPSAESDEIPAPVPAAGPDAAPALPPPAEEPPPADPAPWSGERLGKKAVPRVFLAVHKKAENRASCPLLVPTDLGAGAGAKPRKATFSGGWAVAYDKKGLPGSMPSGESCADCGRSAFGVAGAGVEKGGGPAWPSEIVWSDGSKAGYGPEGGETGARLLAFLEMSDAGCLYNVWTTLGEEHLLALLRGLRRVAD